MNPSSAAPPESWDRRPEGRDLTARGYQQGIRPILEPYAVDLVDFAEVQPGLRVLDVAAGHIGRAELCSSAPGCAETPDAVRDPSSVVEVILRGPTLKVGKSFNRAPISPPRVRLKRTLNRRVGDREYFKWLIADVPPDTVEQLGWQEGAELEGVPIKGGLLLRIPGKRREKTSIGRRRT